MGLRGLEKKVGERRWFDVRWEKLLDGRIPVVSKQGEECQGPGRRGRGPTPGREGLEGRFLADL